MGTRAVWPAMRLALASMVVTAMAALPFAAAAQSTSTQTTAAPGTAPMSTTRAIKLAPARYASYDNRWEIYGGLLYANGQAGQDLPHRFNMGGGEVMGTYWLGNERIKKFGLAADYRYGAGTSQTGNIGAAYGLNRILVMEQAFTGGVEYRTPIHNRYAAVGLHALGGGVYGDFDHALTHYPGYPGPGSPAIVACPANVTATKPNSLGMYCNHVAPYGFFGTSLDFNDTAKIAIRLQPDLTIEHFGTETREFFSISAGVLYRFGKPRVEAGLLK